MPNGFEINNGILEKYNGTDAHVIIPDGVIKIGDKAFADCKKLISVTIPDSVTEIGKRAFECCTNLSAIIIPENMQKIGDGAFTRCTHLNSITIPDKLTSIGKKVFEFCIGLTSITIPDSVMEIGDEAFNCCTGLADSNGYVIVKGVLYSYLGDATSITIPDSVTSIGKGAFESCRGLISITIPDSVTEIGKRAFSRCKSLKSITIPSSVKKIPELFSGCTSLVWIRILDSNIEIEPGALDSCPGATIICGENSYTHNYCLENNLAFIFDYQFEAFNGVLPQSFEKLASPFLADEEKPYIFISYSHKDRDTVLNIIKALYESGWKVWYDEGLTIGDTYDETLEEHVKNCAAFLLFVSDNSLASLYCRENEIPWAIESGKPIIKCILEEGKDYDIRKEYVVATVPPSEIEPALERVNGLTKGERRVAKGISVVVDPTAREGINGDGYAYCLYSENNQASAKAILLDARNNGCTIYDAVESGADEEKLQGCACLIVFLDKAFLSDENLMKTLIEEYKSGRDMAVCQLEQIEDEDLPEELKELHLEQWLNYAFGINADMNTKLTRHLQKRGCRNTAIIPGFEYEITDKGIVLKRYTGMDPDLWIESQYGGIPVVEIAKGAFENSIHLQTIVIIDGVSKIGDNAFRNCTNLNSITIPDSVTEIGKGTFMGCTSLLSIVIPNSVKEIGNEVFSGCTSLTSIIISDSLKKIGIRAFWKCRSLASITIPDSVEEIGDWAFQLCTDMTSITIPDSVTKIGNGVFDFCKGLADSSGFVVVKGVLYSYHGRLRNISIPYGVKKIEANVFEYTNISTIIIPDSVTEIGDEAFKGNYNLTITCPPDSYAWNYCTENGIPVHASNESM